MTGITKAFLASILSLADEKIGFVARGCPDLDTGNGSGITNRPLPACQKQLCHEDVANGQLFLGCDLNQVM